MARRGNVMLMVLVLGGLLAMAGVAFMLLLSPGDSQGPVKPQVVRR
jgi:hypothetical protein